MFLRESQNTALEEETEYRRDLLKQAEELIGFIFAEMGQSAQTRLHVRDILYAGDTKTL